MLVLLKSDKSAPGLFGMPVHISGSVDKDGHVRAPYVAIRKKRIDPPSGGEPPVTKLEGFFAKHGGAERLRQSLDSMTGEQRAKLIDAMAHIGEISTADVMKKLGIHQHQPQEKITVEHPGDDKLVSYTTKTKGRELKGVVRKDLTYQQAIAIDPYTFKLNGGYFIREKHLTRVAAAPIEDGPKEGDTKTEDGVDYVLREGRWHRAQAEPESETEQEQKIEALDAKVEELGGAEKIAEVIAQNPEAGTKLIESIAQNMGVESADVANRLGVQIESGAIVPLADSSSESLSDDYNSENYRFKDTGYVAGSRKELAAEQIKTAAKNGQMLRSTDIDWDEIESNPRQAKQLITKSNMFGEVDWDALRDGGMEPATGFLLDRVYSSVGTAPAEDTPQSRKDFSLAINTLRDRLEKTKTPNDVTGVLDEIRDEIIGVAMNAKEADEYKAAYAEFRVANNEYHERMEAQSKAYSRVRNAESRISQAKYEQEKRAKRKWKPDPKLDEQIAEASDVRDAAQKELDDFVANNRDLMQRKEPGTDKWARRTEAQEKVDILRNKVDDIKSAVQARNLQSNDMTRAWLSLGERFSAIMNWRSFNGSEAFKEHVTSAKNGRVKDWSWAEKDAAAPRSTKKQVSFQLKVADKFERVGGREIAINSTTALKDKFGLREVQSGNWVLKDADSAAFHVQRSAEALADLADILGVPDDKVSMNGRVALAFGARGTGNAGGVSARAHYEPIHRVINLTKMSGGGTLGHELFHAIDNLMKDAHGGDSKKEDYATEDASFLPDGDLKNAFARLKSAIQDGSVRPTQKFEYTPSDHRMAKVNVDRANGGVSKLIKDATSAVEAVDAVRSYYNSRLALPEEIDKKNSVQKKYAKQRDQWVQLAVAYHDGKADGGTVELPTGRPRSSFSAEAINLDNGSLGKYWSQGRELSARAFQSYVEDKLQSLGRRNDYLSALADNKYHVDPIFGAVKPYPEGEERIRINEAFDHLFSVMAKEGTLSKALELVAAS